MSEMRDTFDLLPISADVVRMRLSGLPVELREPLGRFFVGTLDAELGSESLPSEVHVALLGMRLLGIKPPASSAVRTALERWKRQEGFGQSSDNQRQQFLNLPRIHSTYHALWVADYCSEPLTGFAGPEWAGRTARWLGSLRRHDGLFVEAESPSSLSFQLTFYGVASMILLGVRGPVEVDEIVRPAVSRYLQMVDSWSLSDLVRLVRIADAFDIPMDDPKDGKSSILKFIDEVKSAEGWTEFSPTAKASYRDDETVAPCPSFSTLGGLWLTRRFGLKSDINLSKYLAKLLSGDLEKGVGTAIRIKNYTLWPRETTYETVCTLALLSTLEVEDQNRVTAELDR